MKNLAGKNSQKVTQDAATIKKREETKFLFGVSIGIQIFHLNFYIFFEKSIKIIINF